MTGDLLCGRPSFDSMVLTCDGASVHRRMWKLNGDGEDVVYNVDNVLPQKPNDKFSL